MPDFSSLLNSLAKGHMDSITSGPWADMAVGKRRPNAPPAIVLTPSQQAAGDVSDGMNSAHADTSDMGAGAHAAAEAAGGGLAGAGKGLQGSLHKITDNSSLGNFAPVAMDPATAVQPYSFQPVQMRARGGPFDPNQPVIVGEDGPEEIINNTVYPLTDDTYARGGSVDQRVTGLLDQPPPRQPRVSPTGNDIPDQTAQMPVDTSTRPRVVPTDMEAPDPHDVANQRVTAAKDQADTATIDQILAAPEKTNKWKNIGIGIATSAYNATHPQDIQQVKSYGNFKKDRAIAAAQARAGQIGAIQTGRTAEDTKQADIEYKTGRNPTVIEKAKIDAQTKAAQQQSISERQIRAFQNRVAIHKQDADVRAGKAKLFVDKDGRVWKQFLQGDSTGKMRPNEPVVNPTTGEQEFDPGEQMVEWRDPVSGKTLQVKAKTIVSADTASATAKDRLEQQGEQFKQTHALAVEKFTQAKSEFERVHALREQAVQKGDQKAAQDLQITLTKMLEEASKAHERGELDQGQYDILLKLIGSIPK